jgi:hypothetical protein
LTLESFMPDLQPGYNLIRMLERAVMPGRAQARTRNLVRQMSSINLRIPDPVLRTGPE